MLTYRETMALNNHPLTYADAMQAWADDNPHDAIREASYWAGSGQGYGDTSEWPECPGFDWCEDAPDWLEVDDRYGDTWEYRSYLIDVGSYGTTDDRLTPDGWELVGAFSVNPEPTVGWREELCEDGVTVYLGEGAREVVVRRRPAGYVTDYRVSTPVQEHEQYWQGAGLANTPWADLGVGVGDDATEAYDDALEQLADKGWDVDPLEDKGPTERDYDRCADEDDCLPPDCHVYVVVYVAGRPDDD